MAYIPRLKKNIRVIAALKEKFGYVNVMQVPKWKIVFLSKGLVQLYLIKKLIDYAVEGIVKITGQKAVYFKERRLRHSN
jgi:large subunit ribosomal protein L5